MSRIYRLVLTVAVMSVGCASPEPPPASPASAADSQAAHVRDVVASGGVVDSILPIAEHLRRFRATLPDRPDTLRHASASIDALIARLSIAVAAQDTLALNRMIIDRAEFAWLYYPDSKMSKPPYEAPPQLLWGQLLTTSDQGARRMLKQFGGTPVTVSAHECPAALIEGDNRLYEGCAVTVKQAGVQRRAMRLFGTILERDGRFKFVGLTNAL